MELNKESLSHLLDEKHPNPRKKCHQIMQKVDEHLARKCGQKQKHLQPCDEHEPCDCTPCGDHQRLTDLVVLIDTSGSMSGKAAAVSAAAEQAIQAAFERCPNNLRVTWLGIEGTFAGTQFTDTYRDYLNNLGVPCTFAASTTIPAVRKGKWKRVRMLLTICRAVLIGEKGLAAAFFTSVTKPSIKATRKTQVTL